MKDEHELTPGQMGARTWTADTDCERAAIYLEGAADTIGDLAVIAKYANRVHDTDPERAKVITPAVFVHGRTVELDQIRDVVLPNVLALKDRIPESHHARLLEAIGHIRRIEGDIRYQLERWHELTKTEHGEWIPVENLCEDFDRADVLAVADSLRYLVNVEPAPPAGNGSTKRKTTGARLKNKPLTRKQNEAVEMLALCAGNKTEAAKRLEITRKSFADRLKGVKLRGELSVIRSVKAIKLPTDPDGQSIVSSQRSKRGVRITQTF